MQSCRRCQQTLQRCLLGWGATGGKVERQSAVRILSMRRVGLPTFDPQVANAPQPPCLPSLKPEAKPSVVWEAVRPPDRAETGVTALPLAEMEIPLPPAVSEPNLLLPNWAPDPRGLPLSAEEKALVAASSPAAAEKPVVMA